MNLALMLKIRSVCQQKNFANLFLVFLKFLNVIFLYLLSGILESTPPSADMNFNSWKGNLHEVPGYSGPVPLTNNSLLLRVCATIR